MDGSINITLNQVFTKEDSILVVVTFPRHISNDNVVAQRQLAMISGRTICDRLLLEYLVTLVHDRNLVDAGTLVGAHVLLKLICINIAKLGTDLDSISRYILNHTSMLCKYHYT